MDTTTTSTASRRHRGHPPSSALKGAKPARSALWRVIPILACVAAAMFGGLHWAQRYLIRDWSERVAAAREAGRGRGAAPERPGAALPMHFKTTPALWMAHWGPGAISAGGVEVAGPGAGANAWLAAAHASRGDAAERGLLLALSTGAPAERVAVERGRQAFLARRPDAALAEFRRALAAKPGWEPALAGEAVAAARLGRRDLALSALSPLLAAKPHESRALRLAAALLADDGRPLEGLVLLERELAAGGDPALYLDAARTALRASRSGTALRYLDAAIVRGLPLPDIARAFAHPLFDGLRATPEGIAFRQRLAAAARARLAEPRPAP